MPKILLKAFHVCKRFGIAIFICLNSMIMFTAGLPDKSEFGFRFLKTVRPYINFVGMEQPWAMFAPNPTTLNAYIEAQIHFKDGSEETWSMPRPTKMTTWEIIMGGDRYCAIAERFLLADRHPSVWKDVARYVELGVMDIERNGKQREIEMIQFYRYYNYVQKPRQLFVAHGQLKVYEKQATYYYLPKKVTYEARHSHKFN